jgi:hypothetical protein
MASELEFGSPEWRAKYMKPRASYKRVDERSVLGEGERSALGEGSSPRKILQPKFGTSEWRAMYPRKGRGVASDWYRGLQRGWDRLETWQIVLLAAGGALAIQHLIAPKGTSVASKILGGGSSGAVHAGHYVGAVNRGGYGGYTGGGMPFGPGPWPTQHAAAPIENGQSPVRPTTLPQAPIDGAGTPEMAGWGHMEMPTPFGRGGPPYGMGYGGGGGHGGWPYGSYDGSSHWWG